MGRAVYVIAYFGLALAMGLENVSPAIAIPVLMIGAVLFVSVRDQA